MSSSNAPIDRSHSAGGGPANRTIFCAARQELLEDFSEAAYYLTILHREKSAWVIHDDPRASQLDEAIDRARRRKDYAKHAFLFHVGRHGCGGEAGRPELESGSAESN